MNITNQDDLKSLRDLAERYAAKELAPGALHADEYPFAEFNRNAWAKAVEIGIATITLPESLGGMGQGMTALGAVVGCISAVDASIAALIVSQALAQNIVAELAPENAAQSCLCSGELPVIALPLYELPDDLPDTVEFRRDGEGYVLNGATPYLAAAPVARYLIVPAVGGGEKALFLVDRNAKGVEIAPPAVSLGLRQLPAADAMFDSVKVGAEAKLDARRYESIVDRYRAPIASMAVGLLAGSYEAALDYAQERRQSKKMIIEHDMVRVMLTRMAGQIDAFQPLADFACNQADSGGDSTELLSIQTQVTTAVTRATTDGVQVLGGYGYMHEYGQEKRMRDAKQLQSIFGPNAVKTLDVLARKLNR